ncbi:MAG: TetR/AcrR family transcriptional regulator [Egibacteraceae bacterium]
MATRAGGETRDRILDVAQELFATKGYVGTTLRDIAERLGTTVAALYYHFHRKEDLLASLTSPMFTHLDSVLDRAAGLDPDERPRRLLADLLDAMLEHRPTMTAITQDPSALELGGLRARAQSQGMRAVELLAPGGDELAQLRARCAMAVLRGALDARDLSAVAAANRAVVVDAAISALQSGLPGE